LALWNGIGFVNNTMIIIEVINNKHSVPGDKSLQFTQLDQKQGGLASTSWDHQIYPVPI